MSKLIAMAAAVESETTTTEGTLNLRTLVLDTFKISHGRTSDGKNAKVILSPLVVRKGQGTIQIFAPFGMDEQLLQEFPAGAVIDGSKNQEVGYYFEHSKGSNYTWIPSEETAKAMMETTGLNSSPMIWGIANEEQSRQQVQDAKNLQSGRFGKVAAQTEGRVATALSNFFG
jgi:hypothetical protein